MLSLLIASTISFVLINLVVINCETVPKVDCLYKWLNRQLCTSTSTSRTNAKEGKNRLSCSSPQMSFGIRDLQMAIESLKQFRKYSLSPYHERFSFPLLKGTYFTYRKIDVLRVVAIAKAVSKNPRYCDIG
jgi:hypothetical protein